MSLSNTAENNFWLALFNGTAWSGFLGTGTATMIAVALHTADPGETGSQTTSECAYTSYSRVAVARTSTGWTVTNNSVSPVADITFPAATGGSETAAYFSIGTATSGAGTLIGSGTLTPNIAISSGITPIVDTTSTITID